MVYSFSRRDLEIGNQIGLRTIVGINANPFSINLACPCGAVAYGLTNPFLTRHCMYCQSGDTLAKCWLCRNSQWRREPYKYGLCPACIQDIERGNGRAIDILTRGEFMHLIAWFPRYIDGVKQPLPSLADVLSRREEIEEEIKEYDQKRYEDFKRTYKPRGSLAA